jgi:hypothetical protein
MKMVHMLFLKEILLQVNFQGDDHGDVEIRFVLDQHAWWDFYSASSLK